MQLAARRESLRFNQVLNDVLQVSESAEELDIQTKMRDQYQFPSVSENRLGHQRRHSNSLGLTGTRFNAPKTGH